MSSRTTDETFLSTFSSFDFYVIFDKKLSKSEKYERLFQHQMPTLYAWALVASLMIWLPAVLAFVLLVFYFQIEGNVWVYLEAVLIIMVSGFIMPIILFFIICILPIIAIRSYLANRGLVFYWAASFAIQAFLCGLYLYVEDANNFFKIGTLWTLCFALSPRMFGFVLITIFYIRYHPHHNPTGLDNESSLDEHFIN